MSIVKADSGDSNVLHGSFDHAVQFYENELFLYQLVSDFLAGGLRAGESALVVATDAHRRGIAEALSDLGFDSAPVTYLDAQETLDTFMAGDQPVGERFHEQVGGMIAKLSADGARVRAYGEMVDVLWRGGNIQAAIQLEGLWNELASSYRFSLLCAYPMANFYKESDTMYFEDVCGRHTRVAPAFLQQRSQALENEIQRRQKLERELREALIAAQEANRTKDEFLATLSHELRTPLTAMLGWARMLTLGGLDEETRRVACETIERSARTQATLIDDLLDLSRVVTGKLTLQSELVDLVSIVENAMRTQRLAAEAKNVSVDVQLGDERLVVNGDPTRLQQIVWNLVSNAIKFSDAGDHVGLELDRDDDHVRVVVRDEGRGISADFLPHVFEPFRQADGQNTRKHTGLGLGLAIVKYLTELHGGSVSAYSAGPGHGATFTVTLPLALRRADALETLTYDEEADLSGISVLLVDDDQATRELMIAMLRRCGADVCATDSVHSARDLICASTPHIVITDIAMPEHDGFELLDYIRSREDAIPVVALTASAGIENTRFDAWVKKPIDPFEFARVVANVSQKRA